MGEGTLSGQVALVTGGTRGLGKEFVRALAAAGASLAVLSRNQADCDSVVIRLAGNGTAAVGVEADVTDRAQLEVCLELIEEALGPVDILVTNAGIALKKDALDVSVEECSFPTSTPWSRTATRSSALTSTRHGHGHCCHGPRPARGRPRQLLMSRPVPAGAGRCRR